MHVLGIEVGEELIDRWVDWFAPERQPFLVPSDLAESLIGGEPGSGLSDEVRDTFEIYGSGSDRVVLLDRAAARRLPHEVRAVQHVAHHWPGERDLRSAAIRFVERGRRPSRHHEVDESAWSAVAGLLPAARRLAGTFPSASGPNCFGTIMGAAGVEGAEFEWMQQEPFEVWLASHADSGGADGGAGIVLVWRDADGTAQHAAITLGDGWAMHKPSQGWMSPTKVLTTRDVKRSARAPGLRLHRYALHKP